MKNVKSPKSEVASFKQEKMFEIPSAKDNKSKVADNNQIKLKVKTTIRESVKEEEQVDESSDREELKYESEVV